MIWCVLNSKDICPDACRARPFYAGSEAEANDTRDQDLELNQVISTGGSEERGICSIRARAGAIWREPDSCSKPPRIRWSAPTGS